MIVTVPSATMHSLIGNHDGDFLIIEPGYGFRQCDDDFSVANTLDLLKQVKQEGQWGTKISFVYSRNENAVYYCLAGKLGYEFDHEYIVYEVGREERRASNA